MKEIETSLKNKDSLEIRSDFKNLNEQHRQELENFEDQKKQLKEQLYQSVINKLMQKKDDKNSNYVRSHEDYQQQHHKSQKNKSLEQQSIENQIIEEKDDNKYLNRSTNNSHKKYSSCVKNNLFKFLNSKRKTFIIELYKSHKSSRIYFFCLLTHVRIELEARQFRRFIRSFVKDIKDKIIKYQLQIQKTDNQRLKKFRAEEIQDIKISLLSFKLFFTRSIEAGIQCLYKKNKNVILKLPEYQRTVSIIKEINSKFPKRQFSFDLERAIQTQFIRNHKNFVLELPQVPPFIELDESKRKVKEVSQQKEEDQIEQKEPVVKQEVNEIIQQEVENKIKQQVKIKIQECKKQEISQNVSENTQENAQENAQKNAQKNAKSVNKFQHMNKKTKQQEDNELEGNWDQNRSSMLRFYGAPPIMPYMYGSYPGYNVHPFYGMQYPQMHQPIHHRQQHPQLNRINNPNQYPFMRAMYPSQFLNQLSRNLSPTKKEENKK